MERRLYWGPPCIPHQIAGYTIIDGVPQSATVQALIGGKPQELQLGVRGDIRKAYEFKSGPDGHFGYTTDPTGLVMILDKDCWRRGKRVQFTVNGELANESIIFENGELSLIYLNVGTPPEPKMIFTDFYPTKKARAGEYIRICRFRMWNVQVDGNYFLRLIDLDTGEIIHEKTGFLRTGCRIESPGVIWYEIYGTMPYRNWNLKLECGHFTEEGQLKTDMAKILNI